MHSAPVRNLLRRLLGHGPRADAALCHLERGKALAAAGRHADAVTAYQQAIDADPDCAEAHYRAGLAWRDQQQFDAAAESYGRALTLKPEYIEAHNNLGVVRQLENRLEDALA